MRPDTSGQETGGSKIPRIEFQKFMLANGLDVILHEDHKLPVVHVNLWYHVGSKNERSGKTGFAHLFEHMMFEGSRNLKGEYVSLMEKAGANIFQGGVNGTTDFDRTNYFETVPSGSLELVLWAESDRMAYLLDALTQENLDNQRDVVKNERRQGMDNVPYGRSMEMLFENLFPKGHPYSWHIIGKMEDLDNASRDDVKEFFRTYYTPNNCTLVIAGDFDPSEARRLVETYFGPIAPGPPLARPERYVVALESNRRLVVKDRVPQERLYLAWPAVPFFEADDAALDILSNVLSEGKNSRLYKRMVYDEQVASEVSAFNYSLEIAGLLGIIATARPGVPLAKLESLIHDEISRIAKVGPTEEEFGADQGQTGVRLHFRIGTYWWFRWQGRSSGHVQHVSRRSRFHSGRLRAVSEPRLRRHSLGRRAPPFDETPSCHVFCAGVREHSECFGTRSVETAGCSTRFSFFASRGGDGEVGQRPRDSCRGTAGDSQSSGGLVGESGRGLGRRRKIGLGVHDGGNARRRD